jgi:hypothetical protein
MPKLATLKLPLQLTALFLIMLAITGCKTTVVAADPVLPPCLVVPAHLIAPMQTKFLPFPDRTLKPSPKMRCEVPKVEPS